MAIEKHDSKVLALQPDIIYGPIQSRRLGRSLGINLLPTNTKICSLNCCYCQYGWTHKLVSQANGCSSLFPSVQRIVLAVRDVLKHRPDFDFITFSGNGEPTLHPYFLQIVNMIADLRNTYCPDIKIALLSNSTTVTDQRISTALTQIDLPIMKLDVGNERAFKRVNRAKHPVTYQKVLEGLQSLKQYVIQTMFVGGHIDNSTDAEVESWIQQLRVLTPEWVQIYSIARGTADHKLKEVEQTRLKKIAELAQRETGLSVEIY